MRILLTGTKGFIGRHVAANFLEHGDDVVHLGRHSAGLREEVIWDFKSPLPQLPPFDICLHLAANVDFTKEFQSDHYLVNTLATFQLATQAMRLGKPFLFASTTGVHGWGGNIDASSSINLQNPYVMSKYLAEEMIRSLSGRWTIFRIGGVYGLDGPTHLALNRSISEAYHERMAPTLKGDGLCKRNYLSVEDLARWIRSIIVSQKDFDKTVVYLASTEVLSLLDYITSIAGTLAGKPANFEFGSGGNDMIISPSKPLVALTSFSDYLKALQKKRDGE